MREQTAGRQAASLLAARLFGMRSGSQVVRKLRHPKQYAAAPANRPVATIPSYLRLPRVRRSVIPDGPSHLRLDGRVRNRARVPVSAVVVSTPDFARRARRRTCHALCVYQFHSRARQPRRRSHSQRASMMRATRRDASSAWRLRG
jgi:hypothetical protein